MRASCQVSGAERQTPEPGLSARAPWESQGLFGLEAQERGFWLIDRNSEDFLSRKEYGGLGEGQGGVAMCMDDDGKSSEHECVQSWSLARCFGYPVLASPHRASQKVCFYSLFKGCCEKLNDLSSSCRTSKDRPRNLNPFL